MKSSVDFIVGLTVICLSQLIAKKTNDDLDRGKAGESLQVGVAINTRTKLCITCAELPRTFVSFPRFTLGGSYVGVLDESGQGSGHQVSLCVNTPEVYFGIRRHPHALGTRPDERLKTLTAIPHCPCAVSSVAASRRTESRPVYLPHRTPIV